jgi:hypothetical protein
MRCEYRRARYLVFESKRCQHFTPFCCTSLLKTRDASYVSVFKHELAAAGWGILQGTIMLSSVSVCASQLSLQPASRGTASLKATIFTIAQNTLGAGLLTMPFSFKVHLSAVSRVSAMVLMTVPAECQHRPHCADYSLRRHFVRVFFSSSVSPPPPPARPNRSTLRSPKRS